MKSQNTCTSTLQTAHSWAFLVNTRRSLLHKRKSSKTPPQRNRYQYMIIACSKEAKALGVRVGMRYDEAKALIPDLRVLVCNG